MCDKIVERIEKFDIRLTLKTNNPQVKIGRDRSTVKITDSTGKRQHNSEHRKITK